MYIHDILPGIAYTFEFTNHRGERSNRTVIARNMQWGSTPWHKELQFFFSAFDLEKQEVRSFPFDRIRNESFRRFTDEELDMFLTEKVQAAVEAFKATLPTPIIETDEEEAR